MNKRPMVIQTLTLSLMMDKLMESKNSELTIVGISPVMVAHTLPILQSWSLIDPLKMQLQGLTMLIFGMPQQWVMLLVRNSFLPVGVHLEK